MQRVSGDWDGTLRVSSGTTTFKASWDTDMRHSGALSVKMSNMLYLPGIMVVTCKQRGLLATIGHVATVFALQGLLALPFLREHPWEYLAGAFDFSRVFLYKWTVNWRFVPEDIFLSKPFAGGLLVIHLITLVIFLLNRWFADLHGSLATIAKSIRYPTKSPMVLPVAPDCKSSPRVDLYRS